MESSTGWSEAEEIIIAEGISEGISRIQSIQRMRRRELERSVLSGFHAPKRPVEVKAVEVPVEVPEPSAVSAVMEEPRSFYFGEYILKEPFEPSVELTKDGIIESGVYVKRKKK
jgi:hypothetical protein